MAGACFTGLRLVVFVLNLVFWLIGLGLLGVGLWLRFEPSVADFVQLNMEENNNNFNLTAQLMIAAGAMITFVGFLGCCGAWRLSQCMLTGFFLVLILALCLEVACALMAYTQQHMIKRYIDSTMFDTIHRQYGRRSEYTRVFDRIQTELQCCGVKSYKDWLHSTGLTESVNGRAELGIGSGTVGRVPRSCCNEQGLRDYPLDCGMAFDKLELWTYEPFLNSMGCSEALYDIAYRNLDIALICSLAVAIFQLLLIFLSMTLCCSLNAREARKRF